MRIIVHSRVRGSTPALDVMALISGQHKSCDLFVIVAERLCGTSEPQHDVV